MKIKYIFGIAACVTLLASCDRNEANLWGNQTSAQRMQAYLDTIGADLVNAKNGWEMLYFPTPSSGGHILLCQFYADYTLRMAAKNSIATKDVYKEDGRSTWNLVGDQGPVLTFDTYNSIIHAYSDPSIYSAGNGYQGDYEFVVMSHTPDKIIMKGKKRDTYIIMNRLDESQDWSSYYKNIDFLYKTVFYNNDYISMRYISGDVERQLIYNQRTFIEDFDSIAYVYPFLLTPNGITMYGDGLEATNGNAINFELSEDKNQMVCTNDGINAHFESAYTPIEFFYDRLQKNMSWNWATTGMSAKTKSVYDDITNVFSANKGGSIRALNYHIEPDSTICLYVTFRKQGEITDKTGKFFLTDKASVDGISFDIRELDDNAANIVRRCGQKNKVDSIGGINKFKQLIGEKISLNSESGSLLNMQKLHAVQNDNQYNYILELK